MADLLGGTTGQVLAKASNTDMDFTWVAVDPLVILDAKGDLITATAADTPARLAVGANGTSLVADSTTATGLAYASRATLAGNTFTADQNVNGLVVGRSAGNVATNAALGQAALASNTTGSINAAVGNYALGANTTGTYNNAVGSDALRFNTTGQTNNAFGNNALAANTTANNNTAFGNYALAANTTAALNTAVGADALRFNTTAAGNTAVGYSAIYTNTTGSDLSAIGAYALYNNTTGTGNTALGQDAGNFVVSNTTGTNNTFVGWRAAGTSSTVSNQITLGNASISTLRCQVTSITALSDERDKKDIAPLEHGLDFVKQLKPVSFEWNARPEVYTDHDGNEIEIQGKVGIADIGFIAQDIVALEDSLGAADSLQLSYRDNPEKLEVTQGRLIPILVKAIQDLTAKVEALEAAQA
jgi:hypothetical protein